MALSYATAKLALPSRSLVRHDQTGDSVPSPHLTRWRVVAGVILALCTVCVVSAYEWAKTSHGQTYYLLFWVGFGGWFLVSCCGACLGQRSRGERYIWVACLAVLTALPKILMSPSAPIYHDEIAHFQLLYQTVQHGSVFASTTLLPIAHSYPGLESFAAALHFATGLSLWHSALLAIALPHVVVPIEVGLIAEALGVKGRWSALAAFVYMLNPSYVYFDMQFAYEGLALALGCVVTHHLTSIEILFFLVLLSATVTVSQFPATRRR